MFELSCTIGEAHCWAHSQNVGQNSNIISSEALYFRNYHTVGLYLMLYSRIFGGHLIFRNILPRERVMFIHLLLKSGMDPKDAHVLVSLAYLQSWFLINGHTLKVKVDLCIDKTFIVPDFYFPPKTVNQCFV
jgi:hypothetical protein